MARKTYSNGILALLLAAVVLLALILLIQSNYLYRMLNQSTAGSAGLGRGSVSAYITLGSPPNSVEHFVLSLEGKGISESVEVSMAPKPYIIIENSSSGATVLPAGNAGNGLRPNPSNYVLVPDNSSRVIFAGLSPYSNYTVIVNGSYSTYCVPYLACPYVLIRLFRTYTIYTGAANSTLNLTLYIAP